VDAWRVERKTQFTLLLSIQFFLACLKTAAATKFNRSSHSFSDHKNRTNPFPSVHDLNHSSTWWQAFHEAISRNRSKELQRDGNACQAILWIARYSRHQMVATELESAHCGCGQFARFVLSPRITDAGLLNDHPHARIRLKKSGRKLAQRSKHPTPPRPQLRV